VESVRKYVIAIVILFLFSILVYAQEAEKKEDIPVSQSTVSVSKDTSAPDAQIPGIPEPGKSQFTPQPIERPQKPFITPEETKQVTLGTESGANQSVKGQQIPPLKTAFPPASQTAAPQKPRMSAPITGTPPAAAMQPAGNNVQPVPSIITSAEPPALSAAPVSKTSNHNGHVSLNFDDADIYSVMQTVFSEILKVNYIIDPKVKGRVTFRSVAPVPKENVLPLMEVILRLNGVAVVEENSLYRIIPIGDLAREPSAISIGGNSEKVEVKGKALLQVIPVEHVQSSEIIKLITPFTSTNAVIVDVPKTNHIIIVDTDANIKRLLNLITIFDSEQQKNKGPQIFVHHVQNSQAKDICALLQQIFFNSKTSGQPNIGNTPAISTSSSSSPKPASTPSSISVTRPNVQGSTGSVELISDLAKIYADEILNAIIILGTPEDYEIIKDTIAKLDIVPRQVLIEGTIAQLQLTDKMSLGLAWSLNTNAFHLDPVKISLNPTQLSSDTSKTSGLSLIGIDSGNSVRAVINALASKSKAKLLASPHIMVSDSNEARIQVGQQVPLVTSETYGSTGSTSVPIRTIQYKDIGMILKVKPRINDSGLVALQISQEVSTYSKDTLYADETQIILNKTEASTNLVVQDGQTIVIGGLIREDDSKARQGIPFIYKIPILGHLFGNTDNDASRTELVILLTPHVIKDQQDAKEITHKFADKVTDKQMNKEIKQDIHEKIKEQKK